jgi:hypothetical protein
MSIDEHVRLDFLYALIQHQIRSNKEDEPATSTHSDEKVDNTAETSVNKSALEQLQLADEEIQALEQNGAFDQMEDEPVAVSEPSEKAQSVLDKFNHTPKTCNNVRYDPCSACSLNQLACSAYSSRLHECMRHDTVRVPKIVSTNDFKASGNEHKCQVVFHYYVVTKKDGQQDGVFCIDLLNLMLCC